MSLRKAAEMALDWMERYESNNPIFEITEPIQALRQALSQPDEVLTEREAMVIEAAKQGWAMKNEDPFEDAVQEIAEIRARGEK